MFFYKMKKRKMIRIIFVNLIGKQKEYKRIARCSNTTVHKGVNRSNH